MAKLSCSSCGYKGSGNEMSSLCPSCGGLLEYSLEPDYLRNVKFGGPFNFWRYKPVLPKVKKPISLGEGGTPLHEAERLGDTIGLKRLLLKDETRNPTNSFKDRSASLIISDALGKGFDGVVCATNGNHGASLAAYSTMVDIECHLIVPADLDIGKLAQMIVYDAHILETGRSIEEAIDRSVSLANDAGWYQATTELNPLAVEAIKTISYELVEQAKVPDWMVIAMGSGVTMHAIWKGFRELTEMGMIDESPRLVGVQAQGCAPITKAVNLGEVQPVEVGKAETEAVAIRVTAPIYGGVAIRAIKESGGLAVAVTDGDMLESEKEIARFEGLFVEPASAATVACLRNLFNSGEMDRSDSVISLITSSGLKTDDILQSLSKRRKSPGIGSSLVTKERILRTIERRKTYGYELWKNMGREKTLGAIYQHLSDLENRGLISSYTEGKRRYLSITEKGRRVLKALRELRTLF